MAIICSVKASVKRQRRVAVAAGCMKCVCVFVIYEATAAAAAGAAAAALRWPKYLNVTATGAQPHNPEYPQPGPHERTREHYTTNTTTMTTQRDAMMMCVPLYDVYIYIHV